MQVKYEKHTSKQKQFDISITSNKYQSINQVLSPQGWLDIMDLQHFPSLTLIPHSHRLLIMHLLMLPSNLYNRLPRAHLP